jgi:hypothetical protein
MEFNGIGKFHEISWKIPLSFIEFHGIPLNSMGLH